MNWLKHNKGLGAYLLLVLAGSGFLGFQLAGARGRMEESMEAFGTASQELNRLRGLSQFPEKQNLEKLQAQQQELGEEVQKLRSELVGNQLPLEPVTEVEFQDRLKETVERVTAGAAKAGMALPERFYMGFDQYQAEPPKKEAAPHLARQLKAMEWVVSQLIANRAKALEQLQRSPLPEEGERARGGKGEKGEKGEKVEKAERGPARAGRADAAADADAARREIIRNGFEVSFRCSQASFQKTLNDVTSSKAQFYIPSRLEVRNEKEKGPAREEAKAGEAGADAAPAGGAEAPGAADPAAAKPVRAEGELRYIVGEELVVVELRLDIVNFLEPKVEEPKKAGGRSK